jgi:ABC-type antimicrobial peptide transport system permease subunit
MVLFWIIVAIISLFWTPYPENSSLFEQNLPPNSTNWLGTDHLGRDLVSRLMVGTQVILLKTRLPEMNLGGLILVLTTIPVLVSFIAYLVVLAKMFRASGTLWYWPRCSGLRGRFGGFWASSPSSPSSGAG